MKSVLSKSFIASLLIHAMVISSLALVQDEESLLKIGGGMGGSGSSEGSEDGSSGGIKGEKGRFSNFIRPKELEVSIVEMPPAKEVLTAEDSKIDVKSSEEIVPADSCENHPSFGGIGVKFNLNSTAGIYVIESAPTYYPAYKAGIRPGDQLVGDVSLVRGAVGEPVTVHYIRNGQKHSAVIKREKICYINKQD